MKKQRNDFIDRDIHTLNKAFDYFNLVIKNKPIDIEKLSKIDPFVINNFMRECLPKTQ
jgi:hypothetical protein